MAGSPEPGPDEHSPGRQAIDVVAGILIDPRGRILIAQRPDDGRHGGGLWEFPGGKIGAGESAELALKRELAEEIAIEVVESARLMRLKHDYPELSVALDFWIVSRWSGEVVALEGQPLQWLMPAELDDFRLMPADEPVIERLQNL